MKKIILITIGLLISNVGLSQEIPQLKLTPNGVEAIVVEIEDSSASELYNKALYWVQETYKNPDEVLKGNIPNDKIRINGYAESAWSITTLGMRSMMNMNYTLEIEFREGRYRLIYTIGQFYVDGAGRANYNYTSLFNKKGEVRRMYSNSIPELEATMNSLSLSFYNYVSGKTAEKDDNW